MARIFLFLLFFAVVSGAFDRAPALAQQCVSAYGVIVRYSEPPDATFSVWDVSYGDKEYEEVFRVGSLNEKGRNTLVAERYTYEGSPKKIVFLDIDKRGRVFLERVFEFENLVNVVDMLPYAGGYILVANQEASHGRKNVWLGFLDKEGVLQKEKQIEDQGFSLEAHDALINHDGDGFVLAVSSRSLHSADMDNAVMYHYSFAGEQTASYGYMPGVQNRVLGIARYGDDQYIAAGYMRIEDGRRVGWAFMFDESGNLVWQRQYPRGILGVFNSASAYIDGHILVSGYAHPISGKGNLSSWVMALKAANGDISWQRFYGNDLFSYKGQTIHGHDDGLISFAINARNLEGKLRQEYVRLLTLSPRGEVLVNDVFASGRGASMNQMYFGGNLERILVGRSRQAYFLDGEGIEVQGDRLKNLASIEYTDEETRNGWILAAPPTEPYNDPCKQPPLFLP